MTDSVRRLASAIGGKAARLPSRGSPAVYGKWVAAETVDANLSQVLVAGAGLGGGDEVMRFVPKGAHVTGLTAGTTVLCLGNPLCIVAAVVGDITLAS